MAVDIAPELHEKISKAFRRNMAKDKQLQKIMKDLKNGVVKPDYMPKAAERIGEAASKSLRETISSSTLPGGQMYYNIAQRTVAPELEAVYEEVNNMCLEAQRIANANAGIGLNPVDAPINQNRIEGIVERLVRDPYDDVEWILGEPVVNFSQSVHNAFVKSNAAAQWNAGLSPKIIRRVMGHCCDWCEGLAGVYDYGDQPDDFFRMHENCRCQVIFQPAKGDKRGRYQDAHTKIWYDENGDIVKPKERVAEAKKEEKKEKEKSTEEKVVRITEAKHRMNAIEQTAEANARLSESEYWEQEFRKEMETKRVRIRYEKSFRDKEEQLEWEARQRRIKAEAQQSLKRKSA